MTARTEDFERHRSLLFSIAYRMLASVTDAEDIVQEAYLRWREVHEAEVRSPKSYLSAVVTRLSIDRLRSARAQREEYVGEVNCRQIARRARQSVAARRPRFERSPEQEERLTQRFVETCMSGDMVGLLELLSEDVTLWSDGGGKVAAASYPIHGPERVARFLLGVLRTVPSGFFTRRTQVNGGPGVVGYVNGRPTSVVALDVANDRLRGVRIVVNPEKLRAIPSAYPS
jgi:RNA polymerase sigma-70 factor (ECF subfamily)